MDLIYIILILIRANEESETKSIRVRSALTKQCEDWLEGKRGFRVKCGKAPSWVKWDDTHKVFELEPNQKAIMLRKIQLFTRGLGGLKIAELLNREFGVGTVHHTGANVYKEVKRRTLVGELNVKVGDTEYVLKDYYPALLTLDDFNQVIADSSNRGSIKHSQKFVGILSGVDVFKCGCCGKSVGSHVIYRKKSLEDVKSSHKRYGCVEARRNNNCTMKSTIQVEVVENAVVRFCKDKVNLKRILLKGSDRESLSVEDKRLTNRLGEIEENINSLTETLMILKGEPPQAIANKITALELEAKKIKSEIDVNKNRLAKIDNSFRDEVTDRWLKLTNNLNQLSSEERLAIRQLVKDTFRKITIQVDNMSLRELGGLETLIDTKLAGFDTDNSFELTFEFHNDKKRLVRLDRHSGELRAGIDLL
jgi:uncharacterized protein YlaN (UPF0358 family)